MKKSNMIEIMIYVVLIVLGIMALFFLQPKEIEFKIPRQFEIYQQQGGIQSDTLLDQ